MKRPDPGLEPELEAFLEHRKIERRVPPELRARALARGRAVVAAGGANAPAPLLAVPAAPRPMPVARPRPLFRIALAALIAIVGGAVGAMAALRGRSAAAPERAAPASPSPAPRAPTTSGGSRPSEASTAVRAESATPPRPARTSASGDPFTVELELLQRAHAAYTRHDFSDALTLVAAHARRFPRGHLAEQREALRVRSLAGAGRADEAHRAAAAFAVRFPRSVLLPRVAGGSESAAP